MCPCVANHAFARYEPPREHVHDIVSPACGTSVDAAVGRNVRFHFQILGASRISWRAPDRADGARDGEDMTDSSAVEAATRRLIAALDALEAAVERRREADRSESALAAQVQALGTDRSRLASELDGAAAKSRKLEDTNREIAQRLDVAITSIRSVIETQP
jgi:hypothetical protein